MEVQYPVNIFLIGMMGAGKTSVGRALARVLKKEFIDVDQEIEAHTGVNISLIFELEGEQSFRRREKNMLQNLVEKKNIVLATGGGVILDEENRESLHQNGEVIYLCTTPEIVAKRTIRDKKRPLLQVPDAQQRIQALMLQRDPLYRAIADHIVETGYASINAVVENILSVLGKQP